ncbi:hypothetical protein G7B40_039970 [Aetokthonos hydrillicola Thurmond2011]|jgi:uncharacterized metal-binding protein|uniref:Uncharacterized protein n=1 Tax=Aetokthonos hydrillicola Thurmond2011 TaxID=2712845 RepID=A0AAP5IH17_9CYAN|nr:hypothetical protein [Aetokthonos hydrillicola]MBW4590100.1 hypothetical protein [Aetokthonos hydrillicola CCALA 1050]MDR9900669.1 hypothetical protein [Aetokthonos hydrillicola Thurmond2011]
MLGQFLTQVSNAIIHRIGEKLFAENIFGDWYTFSVQAVRDFLEKMEYSADMYSLDAFVHYYQFEVSQCDTEIEELAHQIEEYEHLLHSAQRYRQDLQDKLEQLKTAKHAHVIETCVKSWTKAELQANYRQLMENAKLETALRIDYSRQINILNDQLRLSSSRHRMEVARYQRKIQFLEDRIEFCSRSGYIPPYKFDGEEDIYLEEVVNIIDKDCYDDGSPMEVSIFIAKDWLHKAMLTSPSKYHTYAVGLACPLACNIGERFCEESSGCLPTWIGMPNALRETVA